MRFLRFHFIGGISINVINDPTSGEALKVADGTLLQIFFRVERDGEIFKRKLIRGVSYDKRDFAGDILGLKETQCLGQVTLLTSIQLNVC